MTFTAEIFAAYRRIFHIQRQGANYVSVPSVRVTKYLTSFASEGIGIVRQPVPQTYFHRPLNDLLRPFLAQGMA